MGSGSKRKGGLLGTEEEDGDGEWEDESMDEEDVSGETVGDGPGLVAGAEAAEGEKLPDQVEDEIL